MFFCILRYQYLTKVVLNFKEALYFWALGLVISLIYKCTMFEKECGFVMQMSKHAFISGLFHNIGRSNLSVSYCMVCASVGEMIQKDFKVDYLCYICANHTIPITTFLLHQCAFALCALRDIGS